jgi:hypothetical protein
MRAVAAFDRPLRDRDRCWNAPLSCAACAAAMTSLGMVRMLASAGNKIRPRKRAAPKERPGFIFGVTYVSGRGTARDLSAVLLVLRGRRRVRAHRVRKGIGIGVDLIGEGPAPAGRRSSA